MTVKSMAEIAEEIAAEVKLPPDCRIDIQWREGFLVISRADEKAFAITRKCLEDENYVHQARMGIEMLMGNDPRSVM
jgi:hypothetical protein